MYILYVLVKITQYNRIKIRYSSKWFKMIYLLTKNKSRKFKNTIYKFLVYNTRIDTKYLRLRIYSNKSTYLTQYQKLRFKLGTQCVHKWLQRRNKYRRHIAFYAQQVIENRTKRKYVHNNYKQYARAVRRYSLHQISRYGLKDFEKRSKEFHIDHIVSIKCGYVLNIPYSIIGDIHNLRMLTIYENSSKNGDVDYNLTDKKLFKKYLKDIRRFKNAWIYRYSPSKIK